jgi:hypothetical protein
MPYSKQLLFIIVSFIVFSCKKDNEVIIAKSLSYDNYSGLKPGNYWVYQQFNIDANGNATATNVFDSCYVEKDTLIKNSTFYKMMKPKPNSNPTIYEASYLKDSLFYIVNSFGKIMFSSKEHVTKYTSGYQMVAPSDTIVKYYSKMDDSLVTVTTPAGTFKTLNYKFTYNYTNNAKCGAFANTTRYVHTRYAELIGVVIESFPFQVLNSTNIERRLIRYKLN